MGDAFFGPSVAGESLSAIATVDAGKASPAGEQAPPTALPAGEQAADAAKLPMEPTVAEEVKAEPEDWRVKHDNLLKELEAEKRGRGEAEKSHREAQGKMTQATQETSEVTKALLGVAEQLRRASATPVKREESSPYAGEVQALMKILTRPGADPADIGAGFERLVRLAEQQGSQQALTQFEKKFEPYLKVLDGMKEEDEGAKWVRDQMGLLKRDFPDIDGYKDKIGDRIAETSGHPLALAYKLIKAQERLDQFEALLKQARGEESKKLEAVSVEGQPAPRSGAPPPLAGTAFADKNVFMTG